MSNRRKNPSRVKQLRAEIYMGWTIRKMRIENTGLIFWQTDNNRRENRERIGWESIDQAKAHIQEKSIEVKNEGLGAYALTQAQKIEAKAALDKLGGKVAMSEVMKFWEQHHPSGAGVAIGKTVADWLKEQEVDGLMPTSIRQNRQRLGVFSKEMGAETPVAYVTPERARAFIDGRKCGKVTRESWRKTLRAFFGFCVDRKVVEINPIPERRRGRGKGMEKGGRMPAFLPVKVVGKIMEKAEELHPESVPALAIMFFAGLRPYEVGGQYGLESPEVTEARNAVADGRKWLDEARKKGGKVEREAQEKLAAAREKLVAMMEQGKKARRKAPAMMGGLDWSNVNLAKRFIRVLPETSKTGAGRLVDISDNLLLWLAKYYKASGPVAPTPPTFKRHRQNIMKKAELKRWLPDVARHTYATMHFAMHENQDKLQAMMGHSGKAYVLTKHYKGLATKEEAVEFWGTLPTGADGAKHGNNLQLATAGA